MKFTIQQLTAFAVAAGVPTVEIVEDEAKADYTLDAALEAVDGARQDIIKPKIEQELRGAIAGKFGGNLVQSLIKSTGISRATLEALKTDEERVQAASEYVKSLGGKDKEAQQKQIDDIMARMKEESDKSIATEKKNAEDWRSKYNDRNFTNGIFAAMKDAPIPATTDRMILAADIKRHLQDKYDLDYDEAAQMLKMLTRPTDGSTPTEAFNSKGNEKLKITDAIKEYLEPRGLWSKDMRNVKPDLNGDNHRQKRNDEPRAQQHGQDAVSEQNKAREAFLNEQMGVS